MKPLAAHVVFPRRFAPAAALFCCLVLPALPAIGQNPVDEGFKPIEQIVGDIDPLSRSLRKLSPGLGSVGQDTNVYQKNDKFYYIHNGIVAEFDRSDYIRVQSRNSDRIFQLIPPNTVFHFGLPGHPLFHKPGYSTLSPYLLNQRVSGLAPVDEMAQPQTPISTTGRVPTDREKALMASGDPPPVEQTVQAAWQEYSSTRLAQRRAVLSAIDRAVQQEILEKSAPPETPESPESPKAPAASEVPQKPAAPATPEPPKP